MVKGKGKASGASPKGGVRKIAPARVRTPKLKNTKTISIEAAERAAAAAAAAAAVAAAAAAAPSKKLSKKARPSEAARASAAGSAAASSAGAIGSPEEARPSSSGELFRMTCTCPHLVDHPERAELLRKLVGVRTEVRTRLQQQSSSSISSSSSGREGGWRYRSIYVSYRTVSTFRHHRHLVFAVLLAVS